MFCARHRCYSSCSSVFLHYRCASSSAAFANESHLEAKVLVEDLKQKFGRMGLVSHKKMGVRDLMDVLKASRTKSDYRDSLYAMNTFYNFGALGIPHGVETNASRN